MLNLEQYVHNDNLPPTERNCELLRRQMIALEDQGPAASIDWNGPGTARDS